MLSGSEYFVIVVIIIPLAASATFWRRENQLRRLLIHVPCSDFVAGATIGLKNHDGPRHPDREDSKPPAGTTRGGRRLRWFSDGPRPGAAPHAGRDASLRRRIPRRVGQR